MDKRILQRLHLDTLARITPIILWLFLAGCGGSGDGGEPDRSPSTAQSVSKTIGVKDGVLVDGDPPPPTDNPNSPTVKGNPSVIITGINVAVPIPITIDSKDPIQKVFVQVKGENEHFQITIPGANVSALRQAGFRVLIQQLIELNIPADFPFEEQEFCVLISAQDINGLVSQVAQTCITASQTRAPNTAPIANPGVDVSARIGERVSLDGRSSSDVDNSELTYRWVLTVKPAGSQASLDDPSSPTPNFTTDIAGLYVAELVVSDGMFESNPERVEIIVSQGNNPPNAITGPDQNVFTGTVVVLDGSQSADPDGDEITYSWDFFTTPPGSTAALNDPTLFNPSFTADVSGTYIVTLTVNDGELEGDAQVTINATDQNVPPIADAGNDLSASSGQRVTLNGRQSSDPDNGPQSLSYVWSIKSKPSGSNATLSNGNTVRPSFTPDQDGDYLIELLVSDGEDTATDTVKVSVKTNAPPVCNAGDDQIVDVGLGVRLTGSGSDPDGDNLTYSWSFRSRPSGSGASLASPNNASASFTPDIAGQYVIALRVSDGENQCTDTVVVQASVPTPANNPPQAADDSATTDFNNPVTINVLANDSDPDEDTLSIVQVGTPANGSADNNTTSVTYRPANDFTGSDSFNYTISDGNGGTDTATVRVRVLPPPPTACNTTTEAGENQPRTFTIELGKTSGAFGFSYEMFIVKDRMTIEYQGQIILNTGCVSGAGNRSITYSGNSSQIIVSVSPLCESSIGSTMWNFTVNCP